MKPRIMYIEDKSGGLTGPARIGRVTFSKTGATVHYRGRSFRRTTQGFKSNHIDVESRAPFWISGCRKDGEDRLYGGRVPPVEIDEDVREEYWTEIRGLPERVKDATC